MSTYLLGGHSSSQNIKTPTLVVCQIKDGSQSNFLQEPSLHDSDEQLFGENTLLLNQRLLVIEPDSCTYSPKFSYLLMFSKQNLIISNHEVSLRGKHWSSLVCFAYPLHKFKRSPQIETASPDPLGPNISSKNIISGGTPLWLILVQSTRLRTFLNEQLDNSSFIISFCLYFFWSVSFQQPPK